MNKEYFNKLKKTLREAGVKLVIRHYKRPAPSKTAKWSFSDDSSNVVYCYLDSTDLEVVIKRARIIKELSKQLSEDIFNWNVK